MFSAVLSSGLSLEKNIPPIEYEFSVESEAGQKHSETPFQLISLGIQIHLHDLYPAIPLAIGHMNNEF